MIDCLLGIVEFPIVSLRCKCMSLDFLMWMFSVVVMKLEDLKEPTHLSTRLG